MKVISRKAIRRLRLRRGDIIIVSDSEMVKGLVGIGRTMGLGFDVPILVVPQGFTIKRACKEYVLKVTKEAVIDELVEKAAVELGNLKPKEETNADA
jgi:uroporphyrinogen-III synthase